MILLHRLAHDPEPFHVNPDLIVTVEAAPDTHVTLTTGTKLIVSESVEEVAERVFQWRASVMSAAFRSAQS